MSKDKDIAVEEDEDQGAPEWMVTFSDCMTLLLTFFVLLLSFSSFSDVSDYRKVRISFARAMTSLTSSRVELDSFYAPSMVEYADNIDIGSEKPTLERGSEENRLNATEPKDFHDQKVFLVSSDQVFLGKGSVLSQQGRALLGDMAAFLKEIPNRVVISESDLVQTQDNTDLGLERAWAVMTFLSVQPGLTRDRFNIALRTTVTDSGMDHTHSQRRLEVVLLDRKTYR